MLNRYNENSAIKNDLDMVKKKAIYVLFCSVYNLAYVVSKC